MLLSFDIAILKYIGIWVLSIYIKLISRIDNLGVSQDGVIKWKHFSHYWPFVRAPRWIPRTKASDAELSWFFFLCAWIHRLVNNREPGDLRRFRPHYDVIVMLGNCPQAWSRQATNHYKNHGWPSSMSSYGVSRGRWVKSVCLTLTYIMIWLYVCKLDRVNWSSIKYWWTWLNTRNTHHN